MLAEDDTISAENSTSDDSLEAGSASSLPSVAGDLSEWCYELPLSSEDDNMDASDQALEYDPEADVCCRRTSSTCAYTTSSMSDATTSDDEEAVDEDFSQPGLKEVMEMFLPAGSLAGVGGAASHFEKRALATRLLRKWNGQVAAVKPRLEQALLWREHNEDLFSKRRFELAGDYRVIGVDLASRPVLYSCMNNQVLPYVQFRDQQVVTMLRAIDHLPGGAGACLQIVDLHGMRLRLSDMNPSPMVEWARSQENYFAGMMHQVIIVDMPRMASMLKAAVWPLMPAGVKAKIKFFDLRQTQEYLESTCDAAVADHIIENMQQNRDPNLSLEDRKPHWLQVDGSGELVPLVACSQ